MRERGKANCKDVQHQVTPRTGHSSNSTALGLMGPFQLIFYDPMPWPQ